MAGLGILWSLSVEEHFYLIWPTLFILFANGKIKTIHILIILAAILGWRTVRVLVFGHSDWVIYISTDTRFDSLLYGCLLAIIMAKGQTPGWLHTSWVFYGALSAAFASLLMSFFWQDEVFRSTLRYTIQGIALMPIFFYAVTRSDHLLFAL